jgi:hypothetical protein
MLQSLPRGTLNARHDRAEFEEDLLFMPIADPVRRMRARQCLISLSYLRIY